MACLLPGHRQYLAGPLQRSPQAGASFQPWILYSEGPTQEAQCH